MNWWINKWMKEKWSMPTFICFSGCIGADNLEEIDNQVEPFDPYTIKRVPVPRPAETAQSVF